MSFSKTSLRAQELQAAFARRREVEHQRIERTAAINKYYDHWGKVTSRFANWTTPEYYKKADEKFRNSQENKEKAKNLELRRQKLRELMDEEKSRQELEMREYERPQSRKRFVSTETLEKIEKNARERENIKRQLELEAKLYGRWRHGVDDDNLLFQSKSDQEVMAKLNWLDKQVEEQQAREREEALTQERNLRLQEELNKAEEMQRERQKIREQEISEIRALQESHMEQLKQRQNESDRLKEQESQIRAHQSDLEKELDLLVDSSAVILEPTNFSQAFNLKKIKVFIRKRSEIFRNQIKLIMNILERVQPYSANDTQLKVLHGKYAEQLEAESQILNRIETMYESEAKYNLQRCEEMWQSQHLERYHDVQQLLKAEQGALGVRLNNNLERQEELIKLRSTHLSSIENSNEKLKQLIQEHNDSPRSQLAVASPRDVTKNAVGVAAPSNTNVPSFCLKNAKRHLPQITNSFANLNLDGGQDSNPELHPLESHRSIHSQRSLRSERSERSGQSQQSMEDGSPHKTERPKFARKRVAWT